MNKVPTITILFWMVKIMTTTVGETAADFLNFNLGIGLKRYFIGNWVIAPFEFVFSASKNKWTSHASVDTVIV